MDSKCFFKFDSFSEKISHLVAENNVSHFDVSKHYFPLFAVPLY